MVKSIKNRSYFKINLSLSVLYRRDDGYSEIETVMYPIIDNELSDEIEISLADQFSFTTSGIEVDCAVEDNLCVKAFRAMQQRFSLPEVHIHLHKSIPFGAGLGAGSANATEVLKITNQLFELSLSAQELEDIASTLGSDTPFFVRSTPSLARGRGEVLSDIDVTLSGYYIYFVKPDVGVSTAVAYRGVEPHIPALMPSEAIDYPIERWQEVLHNDFEPAIFKELPILSDIKQSLINSGAIYASMSGSGSTVFGIFREMPPIEFPFFTHCSYIE